MTLTRYDAMFFACGVAAWFIIGDVELWQILTLGVAFTGMFFAGELKEGQRIKRLIKEAAL